jgi:ketosteroid isomerase-like protein
MANDECNEATIRNRDDLDCPNETPRNLETLWIEDITDAVRERVVTTLYRNIDDGAWHNLHLVFSDDIVYERPGYEPLIGWERVEKFYRHERVIASGRHSLEHIVIKGCSGACWGRFIGEHKNGTPINEGFADTFTFENVRIKTRRSFFFTPVI